MMEDNNAVHRSGVSAFCDTQLYSRRPVTAVVIQVKRMLDLSITEDQIAESRSRWLPELDSFAKRTSKLLLNTRSLPIHDAATAMASKWFRTHALPAFKKQSNRHLILVGDEHLHRAASSALSPYSVPHTVVFPSAWLNWC